MGKVGDGGVLSKNDYTDGTQVHEEVSSLPTPSDRPAGQVIVHEGRALKNTGSSWEAFNDTAVPIGGIIAWDKSMNSTPTLPEPFAECNGQTINDPESPYDGQTLPDINGNNRFLRGNSSSGGTGGSASVSLSVSELPSHSHGVNKDSSDSSYVSGDIISTGASNNGTFQTHNTGSSYSHENEPPYYDVVYVIRIK